MSQTPEYPAQDGQHEPQQDGQQPSGRHQDGDPTLADGSTRPIEASSPEAGSPGQQGWYDQRAAAQAADEQARRTANVSGPPAAAQGYGAAQDAGATQWYGAPSGQRWAGGNPASPPQAGYYGSGQHTYTTTPVMTKASARRRWDLPAVAVLAALLAGGAVYGVDALHNGDSANGQAPGITSSTVAAPVAQANASAPDWATTASAVSPSVVSITVTSGSSGDQGSGVIVDKAGHIVTNNHVVSGAGTGAKVTVTLNDSRVYAAKVVGKDASTDLAVIQLQKAPNDLTPITFGNASSLKVGQPVMAIGNPLGLSGTVTTGIVSALNRPVTTQDTTTPQQQQQDPFGGGDGSGGSGGSGGSSGQSQAANPVVTNAVQTSAAINPGNSGGALVNSSGQLVGINSAIASLGSTDSSGQSGSIGIGFAIPSNEVKSIANQLIKTGKAEHAYMGVSTVDATVSDGSAKQAGAGIASVVSSSPAAKAGLKKGDTIVAIDGESVDSSLALVGQVHERSVGQKTAFTIVRDGKRQMIDIVLGANPNG